jgi:hypothetical protein
MTPFQGLYSAPTIYFCFCFLWVRWLKPAAMIHAPIVLDKPQPQLAETLRRGVLIAPSFRVGGTNAKNDIRALAPFQCKQGIVSSFLIA